MNQYRMFFVQTSTRPPNMHLKLAKHGRYCKQNNQLPTKSHDELKDKSSEYLILWLIEWVLQNEIVKFYLISNEF